MNKPYPDKILAAIHETALGLADAGVLDEQKMRLFDDLCLEHIEPKKPIEASQKSPPVSMINAKQRLQGDQSVRKPSAKRAGTPVPKQAQAIAKVK
jgi:putative transcriptional regulator